MTAAAQQVIAGFLKTVESLQVIVYGSVAYQLLQQPVA
jgi:hypothetical protein